ncbi:unnamed protein product [Fraxinus pennsylvanica]|uniref:Uncharacterized protein n=1 Tax=Fraxinus pennsylvanica TaxID=56036 RepID=A0AAD1YVX1_9LAMI|nr:unnamed protein product [Fraxinus pennsylvanica]
MTLVVLFVSAMKLVGILISVTVSANAFSFSGFQKKNLKPFRSSIDESSDILAVFNNIQFDDKGTILELLESLKTTPSIVGMHNNDDNRTIRRRPAIAVEKIPKSDFNAVNEDSENIDEIRNGCGGVVESEESEELINNKEVEDKKIKENGESSKGMEASAVKFSYQPLAPAHWRIKESPLSSDHLQTSLPCVCFVQVPSIVRSVCVYLYVYLLFFLCIHFHTLFDLDED